MNATELRDKLYPNSIYQLFKPMPEKLEGWGSHDPNFKVILDAVKPQLIVEVGSWLGLSAIHMAKNAPEAQVFCVDTWLGSQEFWTDPNDASRYGALNLKNGFPQVYYQFLSNVYHSSVKNQITPMPMTSRQAFRLLRDWQVSPDLIYIDASHEYDDVTEDLTNYWSILRRGGVMFGDDWNTWGSVRTAVQDWGTKQGATVHLGEGDRQWSFQK